MTLLTYRYLVRKLPMECQVPELRVKLVLLRSGLQIFISTVDIK